ncbi:hypothetical protein GCM10009838_40730 [Catenulispora subtropica]|uniref:Uncharacterized protein n=2 Tax=Catenulispora subtropica TaxID=450798 RepID=A0ABP5DC61_9ACTN
MIAQVFDEEGGARGRSERERAAEVARLRVLLGGSAGGVGVGVGGSAGGGLLEDGVGVGVGIGVGVSVGGRIGGAEDAEAPDVPALPALRGVLPGGVLRRGGVVAVQDRTRSWGEAPSYLALALAAGASAGGAWCGVVGLPAFGIAAAAGMGADLGRFLMVDEPGDRWAEAVGVLAGAVDLLLVRPPRLPNGEHVRRIGARIRRTVRQRGAALVVAGEWPGADLRLRLTDAAWSGLGAGTGHLTGRRVTLAADGRGAAGRERTARLWLPAADGAVREWAGEAMETGDVSAAGRQPFGVSAEIREGGEVVRLWSA